jgi:2-oxoglutarate dehydrogenase E2 component (dihydrolipoamide succinyltransferase)
MGAGGTELLDRGGLMAMMGEPGATPAARAAALAPVRTFSDPAADARPVSAPIDRVPADRAPIEPAPVAAPASPAVADPAASAPSGGLSRSYTRVVAAALVLLAVFLLGWLAARWGG